MNAKVFNGKLRDLLLQKRIMRQFIEREARQYPGARSRGEHREHTRKIHGWHELPAEIKALKS